MMQQIKKELHKHCLDYAEERIKNAENAILSAQEAGVNDTKSSAGDKYETTREMMQQEISRNQVQLQEAQKLKHQVSRINPDKCSEKIQTGSLVITNNGNFYITISAGQFIIADKSFFTISPASPLGLRFNNLKTGDGFSFNGREFKILAVF